MERHHVAVALQILSTDDCNIAENLNDVEYKEFVELVQWNIIGNSEFSLMIYSWKNS